MVKSYKINPCGLCCDICDSNTSKLKDNASYVLEVMKDAMVPKIMAMMNPDFNQDNVTILNEMLEMITGFPPCPGCEGMNQCTIKQCAMEKGLEHCSSCEFLNVKEGKCMSPSKDQSNPIMPPAPIFLTSISKRYKKWNINSLEDIKNGNSEAVFKKIEDIEKQGKSYLDIVDKSMSLM